MNALYLHRSKQASFHHPYYITRHEQNTTLPSAKFQPYCKCWSTDPSVNEGKKEKNKVGICLNIANVEAFLCSKSLENATDVHNFPPATDLFTVAKTDIDIGRPNLSIDFFSPTANSLSQIQTLVFHSNKCSPQPLTTVSHYARRRSPPPLTTTTAVDLRYFSCQIQVQFMFIM